MFKTPSETLHLQGAVPYYLISPGVLDVVLWPLWALFFLIIGEVLHHIQLNDLNVCWETLERRNLKFVFVE